MQEQKLKTSDENIGLKLKVGNSQGNGRITISKKIIGDEICIGDEVHVLTQQQYYHVMQVHDQSDEMEKLKDKLSDLKLEHERTSDEFNDLQKEYQSLQDEVANKDNEIESLKSKVSELEQSLEQNNEDAESIDKYKQELQTKYEIIDNLTTSRNDYKTKYEDLQKTTTATINQLKARIDELGIQLDNSADASELQTLQQELDKTKKELEYWQNGFDELSEKEIGILDENETLRKDNNAINQTNQLLNDNILGLTASFESTKEQLTLDFEKQENELKETIKNNQSHIDELTDKYQSLLPLKDNIAPKQHYDELSDLKDELNAVQKELDKTNAEIESKLAIQKSELEMEYNNEKAHLLVAYNKDIDNQKMKYNELAKDYNHLLSDAKSLTRINTFWNGRHNDIVKDKTPVELEVITSEQLPPSDENVVEFVPKE